jgi:hypothetical protein
MLEYAANAVHWPANTMRDKFEKNCADPEGRLTDFLGEDCDAEEFWEKAETNLKEGKIRMLFVADVIPPELQCIVEFLNKQMEYAEVLAVEIKQYVGENMKTLVPRVIGQTIEAATRKSSGAIRKVVNWDKQLFFSELGKNLDEHDMGIVQQLFDYCEASGGEIGWGNGAVGSFNFKWPAICRRSLFTVKTNGRLTLNFGWFHTTEVAEHFLNNGYLDLAQSLGFDLPAEPQNKWCDILIEEWGPKLDAFTAGLTKLLKQEATSSRDNP